MKRDNFLANENPGKIPYDNQGNKSPRVVRPKLSGVHTRHDSVAAATILIP
jgi:hypothetical protein